MNTCQKSKFVDAENVDCLTHSIIYSQIFNQNLIWSWMIYIACSLKTWIHLICNHVKSNRCLRISSTHAISITFSILKSYTNSHYVMSQCDDFICFRNDRIRNIQIYTCSRKSFAQILDFRFTFLNFRRFFILIQFADAVKDISSSICLAVDSHWSSRELKAVKYPWESLLWENVDLKKSQKLFVFSDFSLVFRKSSKSCLFVVSTLFARSITHLERTSWFEKV